MKFTLTIPGEPVAQGRPRFSTINGVLRAYDPLKSREYKEYVKLLAMQQRGRKQPMEGPLSLSVRAYMGVPASWTKKKRLDALEGRLPHIVKPDLENICKGVTDALKGIVFIDDSQIVEHHQPFGKWYSDKPRVEIEIKEIEG